MRLKVWLIAPFLGNAFLGSASISEASVPSCHAAFNQLLSDEVFAAYSVSIGAADQLMLTDPDVRVGKAHLYRSAIKAGARNGPNFAGHFTIIPIGCGAATICLAITDSKTGKVYFPPELNSVEALLVDTGSFDVHALNFRRSSRLLVVVGSPNEQRKRAGVSYYIWQDGSLRRAGFTPAAKLCGLPASTQF